MTLRTLGLAVLCFGTLLSCSQEEPQETPVTTLSFWHFWSEPHQQAVLDSLLREYEARNPSIHVAATPLSWSDGKAKLQLAFNSQNAPDIVHLGLDWFSAFDNEGVFASLNNSSEILRTTNGKLWTVNARAMVMSNNDNATYYWGLCGSDSHNVLKRVLPIVWQQGAPSFCTHLPISSTMDSSLTDALWSVSKLSRSSLVARSRDLDEAFLNDELKVLYTGTWIREMAQKRGVDSLVVIPTPSILNGDVLAIAGQSESMLEANKLIEWITSITVSETFCNQVPDAGFPAHFKNTSVTIQPLDAFTSAFLQTVQLSSPLPMSSTFLEVEPVLEALIEQCYFASSRTEVRSFVETARSEVRAIESR